MKKLMFCVIAMLSAVVLVAMPALAGDSVVSVLPWYAKAKEYYTTVTSVLGTAAIVATMTPTPKDDAFISKIQKVIHLFGLNFGFAKNKG